MKLVTYTDSSGRTAPGVLVGDGTQAVDLSGAFPDMLALLDAGVEGMAAAQRMLEERVALVSLDEVTLLAPVPIPRRIRDCSVFEEHMAGGVRFAERMGIAELTKIPDFWYEYPIYYKGNHLSVVGPDAEITWPTGGALLDYELEIAVVIGTPGKDIKAAEAMSHIAGFVIYNDLSLRDLGFPEVLGRMGPAKAKDFDTGNVLGPWLVTPDEIADPYALTMRAAVNGEYQGGGSTADMFHRWDSIIEWAARSETLVPGEVIGAGTVGGGTLAEHGRFLEPGDVISFEVDGLGVLSNRIGVPAPGARPSRPFGPPISKETNSQGVSQ